MVSDFTLSKYVVISDNKGGYWDDMPTTTRGLPKKPPDQGGRLCWHLPNPGDATEGILTWWGVLNTMKVVATGEPIRIVMGCE